MPKYEFDKREKQLAKNNDKSKQDLNVITMELNFETREIIFYRDYERAFFYRINIIVPAKYYFYVYFCDRADQKFQIVPTQSYRLKSLKQKLYKYLEEKKKKKL